MGAADCMSQSLIFGPNELLLSYFKLGLVVKIKYCFF